MKNYAVKLLNIKWWKPESVRQVSLGCDKQNYVFVNTDFPDPS